MYQFQPTANDGELPTSATSKPSPSTYTDSIKFYEKMSHLHNQLKTYEQKQFVLEDEFQKLWTEQQTLNNNKNETSSQVNGNSPAPDYSNSNPIITLENDTNRKLRNAKILAKIQELESASAIFTARSERLRIMKTEYESLVQKYKTPVGISTRPSTSTSSIKVEEGETKLSQPITRGVNTYITGPIIPLSNSQETILTSTPCNPSIPSYIPAPAEIHEIQKSPTEGHTTMRMGVGNPSYNLKPTFEENFEKFTNSGNKQLHTIFTPTTNTNTYGINANGYATATSNTTTNGNGFIKRILDFEGIEESSGEKVDVDVGHKNLYFDISSTSDSDQETSKSIPLCTLKRSGSIRMTGGGKRVSYNIDTSDTSNTTSMAPNPLINNLKIKPEITQNLQGILKTSNSKIVEPTASESTTVSESISSKNKLRNEIENENEIQSQDSKDQVVIGSFSKLNNSVFGIQEVDNKMMMNEMEIDLSQDQESVDEIPSFKMEEEIEIELDKEKDVESRDFDEKNEFLDQKIEPRNELNGLGNIAGGFNSGFLNNLGKNEGLGEKRDLDLEKNDNDLWNERDIDQEILKASQTQVINKIPAKDSDVIEKDERDKDKTSGYNSASNISTTTTTATTDKRRLKLKLDYGDSESDSSEKVVVISSEKNTNNGKTVNYKEVDENGGNSRAFNLPNNDKNSNQVVDDDFDDFFDI